MLELSAADDETRALMASALRGASGFDAEYPTVFGPRARGCVVRDVADGRVRSACAILVRDLRAPGGALRVGLIGSVATASADRGRGLATNVLERAERELARRGCVASLLWADDETFYGARGYARVGCEEDFVLGHEVRGRLPQVRGVRPARAEDAAAIHRLYREHPRRALRTQRETAALLAAPGMRVLVHEAERANDDEHGAATRDVDAYLCLGRGGDLVGAAHEWGGDPDALLRLLRAALDDAGAAPLYLMAPLAADGAPEPGLPTRLRELGVASAPGVLAMGKLLDPAAAIRAIDAAACAPIAWNDDPDRPASRTATGPRGAVRVSDERLLEALFGVSGRREAAEAFERATGATIPALPLAPFLWGLDSI